MTVPPPSSFPSAGSGPGPDPDHPFRYSAALAGVIEPRWQREWRERGSFVTKNPGEAGFDASRPKFYCLDMFPYPSGAGLHIGHPEGYTATDIVCRYKRAKGFNVLHPMGWDAFGLPAEQYAIQTGVHPAITTRASIENFRRQLQRFGFCYDWEREFGTIDETYYKWTQWIFLKLYGSWFDPRRNSARPIEEFIEKLKSGVFGVAPDGSVVHFGDGEHGAVPPAGTRRWYDLGAGERGNVVDNQRLAFLAETTVNWCPKLGTVLANDEVIDGRSERGGHPVLRRPLKQWMFRITAYAERLLSQLGRLDWPPSTKAMQAEWIGKSEGAEIEFEVVGSELGRLSEPTSSPSLSSHPLDSHTTPSVTVEGFEPRDPYPKGQPSPTDLKVSIRNLPHLELPNATYFVTWQTKPGQVLSEAERDACMKALRHFDTEKCAVYAASVMPDHVHWIVRPYEHGTLGDLVSSVKRFSATQVNAARGDTGSLWQADHFDHIVRDEGWFGSVLKYVVQNPVVDGLVARASDYRWTFVSLGVRERDGSGLEMGVGGGGRVGSESRPTKQSLRVFTTRPDTLFGATYMVVAPEHELCAKAARGEYGVDPNISSALKVYCERARNRSDIERQQETKEKTGAFTGVYAINPASGVRIPIWTADYVLMGYGTGAIMAVPAHDERDYEFARAFDLPIRDVVYSGITCAMDFFARRASPDEQISEAWAGMLADLLGVTVSRSIPPSRLDEALNIVRHGRPKGSPVPPPDRRGSVQTEWLDMIATVGLKEFEDFRDVFLAASFHRASGAAFTQTGYAVNSSSKAVDINGLPTEHAKVAIIAWLERSGIGRGKVNYRLRDWTFSRQRYWGEPFPIVYDAAGKAYPVSESHLPVTLPELADYAPIESDTPQPLLAKATAWMNTTAGAAGVDPALLPPETPVTRETNTMPGSAGSSWYAIRYCDPKNAGRLAGKEAEAYWMGGDAGPRGVDLYLGGSEHAVGHLLYSRFWQNVLFDLGEVSTPEPFHKLVHQGLITSFAYQRPDKTIVPVDEVKEVLDGEKASYLEIATGKAVAPIVTKMSKRYKNVVSPDDVINEFGADTCRLYEMYMGPLEASKPWNPRDISGCHRFLQRAWRLCVDEKTGALKPVAAADANIEKLLHRTIAKVGADIERLAFNTAIAAMIEFVNAATTAGGLTSQQMSSFALVLGPFAPHMAEELWAKLGNGTLLCDATWPTVDESKLKDDQVEIPVQIMGKVRGRVMVAAAADETAARAAVMADAKLVEAIGGKAIKKVIYVPGRMINLLVG